MVLSSDRLSVPTYLAPVTLSTADEGRHGCGNLLIASMVVDETRKYRRLDVNR
jgi:hypothetical protein